MKKFVLGLVCFLALGTAGLTYAEKQPDPVKERQKVEKQAQKDLNKKASKDARNEAKRLKKEGWKVAPGALPLDKMLDKAYIMQYEFDNNGLAKYIYAEGMSSGTSYDAAKMQALEMAKQNLASQIQTDITALVESTVTNAQKNGMNSSDATTIMATKNLISQKLGRVQPVVEAYREKGREYQVMVKIFYSSEMAKQQFQDDVIKSLEQRADKLHDELDERVKNK